MKTKQTITRNYNMKKIQLIALSCLSLALGGCATLTQPDDVPVKFKSNRAGAVCKIISTGQSVKTPGTIDVTKRCSDLEIECTHNGKTVHRKLPYRMSKALAGNIIAGGVIGVGVDALSQKACSYPEELYINFD